MGFQNFAGGKKVIRVQENSNCGRRFWEAKTGFVTLSVYEIFLVILFKGVLTNIRRSYETFEEDFMIFQNIHNPRLWINILHIQS